jgi:hypothetical protein
MHGTFEWQGWRSNFYVKDHPYIYNDLTFQGEIVLRAVVLLSKPFGRWHIIRKSELIVSKRVRGAGPKVLKARVASMFAAERLIESALARETIRQGKE